MEDFDFTRLMPKRFIKWIILVIVLISIIYGVITNDRVKAYKFYSNNVQFVFKPLLNKVERIMKTPLRMENKDINK